MEMIKKQPVENGTVIITDNQTKGRGQFSNVWEVEPGQNLTFSIIYKTDFLEAKNVFDLNIAVSVALQKAVSEFIEPVFIKWPNDLISNDKKIGGLLIENTLKGKFLNYSIIGIGININQENFNIKNAGSLFTLTKRKFELEIVLNTILNNIDRYLLQLQNTENKEITFNLYLKSLYRLHQISNFDSEKVSKGEIIGVDKIGRLMVESEGNVFHFANNEVKMIY